MPKPSVVVSKEQIQSLARLAKQDDNAITFVGFDPGKQGGIVALFPTGKIEWWLMPEGDLQLLSVLQNEIAATVSSRSTIVAGIEKVNSMPGEGHKGAFTFGAGYGALKMAIAASGFKKLDVHSRTWQAFFKIKPRGQRSKSQFKSDILLKAHERFPEIPLWREPRTKGKQLAICDALLIAEYTRLTYK